MKKEKAKQLISDGYKIKVYIHPNKNHDGSILSTIMYKENENVIHPVYYNHVKDWLNNDQLRFIELYNKVKNFKFRDDVEMNMKYKSLQETKEDIEVRIIRTAIRKLEYLEQL